MRPLTGKIVIAIYLPLLFNCASIVSRSSWPLYIGSAPIGANISITNKKGNVVFAGMSPAAVKLKSGAGFFMKESYRISITKAGYDERIIPLECKVNGWYAGNILIGGLIGLLIVDPATGAMYKLGTDTVFETLASTTTDASPTLHILSINELPTSADRGQLVRIPE